MLQIRRAGDVDFKLLQKWDHHVSEENLEKAIENERVFLAESEGAFLGWLRYNLFWDSIPFLNMLYVLEEHRGQGVGKALMARWEKKMKELQGCADLHGSLRGCPAFLLQPWL